MPSCEVLVQGWPLALQLWSPRKSWTNGKSKLHPQIAWQWKNKHAKMYFLSKIFKCSIATLVSWRVPFWILSDLPATRHPLIRLFFLQRSLAGEVWNGYISSSMDACGSKVLDPNFGWRNDSFKTQKTLPTTVILLMEEILHQLIDSLSHYLQGFIHPRWCRILSINSINKKIFELVYQFHWTQEFERFHTQIIWWAFSVLLRSEFKAIVAFFSHQQHT